MTSQVRLVPAPLPPIEAERALVELIGDCAQSNIAAVCGLANHRTIGDRLALVSNRQVDGYLDALTGAQIIKLARAHGPLGAAVSAYIAGDSATTTAGSLVDEVREEIDADADLIATCNRAAKDNRIDRQERRRLAKSLRAAVARHRTLLARLEQSEGD